MTQKEKDIQKRIDYIIPKIEAVLKDYPVRQAGLFGSVLRDDYKAEESDIDLLIDVEHSKKFSLFDLARIELKLEEKLGSNVDLVVKKSVKEALKQYILPEVQYFYEKNI